MEKLKSAVQRTLDRLVIVRCAEDNLIMDDPNILSRKLRDWKTTPAYNSIVDLLFADRALFDKFNDIHNGRIFERVPIPAPLLASRRVYDQIDLAGTDQVNDIRAAQ